MSCSGVVGLVGAAGGCVGLEWPVVVCVTMDGCFEHLVGCAVLGCPAVDRVTNLQWMVVWSVWWAMLIWSDQL